MKILNLGDKFGTPIAIALGFFDCIHKGHRSLVRSVCNYAHAHDGVESALLTFSNDPSSFLGRDKQIYSFEERADALESLGLQNLISIEFDKEFAELEPTRFLDLLTHNLNIGAIVIGRDYTFGKRAKGDIALIKSYFENKKIDVIIEPFEKIDGKKISTSSLKSLVKSGDIELLNSYLTEPYFMMGEVEHARSVGRKLGFPTANILFSENRLPLASGVYATILQVDGNRYASMTNVGAKPTFDIDNPSIEAHLLDFDGDLYGKTVKLSFISKLRGIVKFASPDELKAQLKYDEVRVRKLVK